MSRLVAGSITLGVFPPGMPGAMVKARRQLCGDARPRLTVERHRCRSCRRRSSDRRSPCFHSPRSARKQACPAAWPTKLLPCSGGCAGSMWRHHRTLAITCVGGLRPTPTGVCAPPSSSSTCRRDATSGPTAGPAIATTCLHSRSGSRPASPARFNRPCATPRSTGRRAGHRQSSMPGN